MMSWERIWHLEFGLKDHIIGMPTTKAEKARTASQLGEQLREHSTFSDGFVRRAASEELIHALELGRCEIGYTTNIFGRVVGAYTKPLYGATPEELYASAIAGAKKWTGRMKAIAGGIIVREPMVSRSDFDIARDASAKLKDQELQAINQRLFGSSYCPDDLDIWGFSSSDVERG